METKRYKGVECPILQIIEGKGEIINGVLNHYDDNGNIYYSEKDNTYVPFSPIFYDLIAAIPYDWIFNPEGICIVPEEGWEDDDIWEQISNKYLSCLGFVKVISHFSDGKESTKFHLVVIPSMYDTYRELVGSMEDEDWTYFID